MSDIIYKNSLELMTAFKQSPKYEFQSESYQQVFFILKTFGQENRIEVNCLSDMESQELRLSDSFMFKKFGIDLRVGKSNRFELLKRRYYLLILSEADLINQETLDVAITAFCSKYEIEEKFIFYVAIDTQKRISNDAEVADIEQMNAVLRRRLPRVTVFNKGFEREHKKSSNTLFFNNNPNVQYINIVSFFKGLSLNSGNNTLNHQNVLKVLTQVLTYKGKKVIFIIEDDPDVILEHSMQNAIWGIAAYCTLVHGLRFEFYNYDDERILNAYSRMTSQNYNYLNNYLKMVGNPLDYGFRIFNGRLYHYVKDFNSISREPYRVLLEMYKIPFDLGKKDFSVMKSSFERDYLDNIEMLSLQDVFNLESNDWQLARVGARELNKVFAKFEKHFAETSGYLREPLNVTNTLLYQKDGCVFLAQVVSITGSCPYQVLTSTFRTKFHDKLRIADLYSLYDSRLALDSAAYIKLLGQSNALGKNLHYDFTKSARGVVLDGIAISKDCLEPDCGFTISEIGLWLAISSQFRNNLNREIIDYVTVPRARKLELLTCFGGPHGSMSLEFDLSNMSTGGSYV